MGCGSADSQRVGIEFGRTKFQSCHVGEQLNFIKSLRSAYSQTASLRFRRSPDLNEPSLLT